MSPSRLQRKPDGVRSFRAVTVGLLLGMAVAMLLDELDDEVGDMTMLISVLVLCVLALIWTVRELAWLRRQRRELQRLLAWIDRQLPPSRERD